MSGNLFLIVAPSGAGKSTLVKVLLEMEPTLSVSISYTTRLPRVDEVEGKDYFFVTAVEFAKLKNEKNLLEWAKVHGNYYGTPRDWVFEQLEQGKDIILEIDWQGAKQIKSIFPRAIEIFILPPSLLELENRLRRRGGDAEEAIVRRLSEAHRELGHAMNADYIVINLNFRKALEDLQFIVFSSRLSSFSQSKKHKDLFASLGISSLND